MIRIGHRVKLFGLRQNTDLNGREGEVESLSKEEKTWLVRLDDFAGRRIFVKPENVKLCEEQIEGDHWYQEKRENLPPSIRHGVRSVTFEREAHCIIVKCVRDGKVCYIIRALKEIEAGTPFLEFWGLPSENGINESTVFVKDE